MSAKYILLIYNEYMKRSDIFMDDNFVIEDYLEGSTIYSKGNLASQSLKLDDEDDEVYIPEDVLNGKREWNLEWDKNDQRNRKGIFVLREK